ncbi:hypothetical protein JCM10207_004683 [Rhodosporidiobolus poonsookiae]
MQGKQQLLGTPIRPRDQRSTGAPSPVTPFPSSSSSSNNSRPPPPPNPFQARTGSPLKQATNLPSSPSATSDTFSQPSRASSPVRSSSLQPAQVSQASRQKQRTEDELKAQARAAVLRTRIVADPSVSTAFRKEEDPELFALFVGP